MATEESQAPGSPNLSVKKKKSRMMQRKKLQSKLNQFDSLPWNASVSIPDGDADDPFSSILTGSGDLDGGFLSLEEIDEADYTQPIPTTEKQNTNSGLKAKKRKRAEGAEGIVEEIEAENHEETKEENAVSTNKKKEKKKKRKKNKKKSNADETHMDQETSMSEMSKMEDNIHPEDIDLEDSQVPEEDTSRDKRKRVGKEMTPRSTVACSPRMTRSNRKSSTENQSADLHLVKEAAFYEGDRLVHLLKLIRRGTESARLEDESLPEKIWIKKQFAIGVNDVTRVLERTKLSLDSENSTQNPNSFRKNPNSARLQVILLAADCNPRMLTKHLPGLAASRNVPIVSIRDKKQGSLRLGELVKLKTALAVGIKARGNEINRVIEKILEGEEFDVDLPCVETPEMPSAPNLSVDL